MPSRSNTARVVEALERALRALPDTSTGGPEGDGYRYVWDACTGDEQEWVQSERAFIRAVLEEVRAGASHAEP